MMKLLLLTLCVCFLAWYFNSSIPPRAPPLVNDDYSEFFEPQKLQLPETEEAIVRLVREASSKGQQVRVLGSGHSRNSLAQSHDTIVSLEKFKGVTQLDVQTQQVTVRAGTTLSEMVIFLDEQGLTLGVLPAILEQTVAGAISTGTHGSRSNYGNLATLVTKLRLVTASGDIRTLSATDNNTDLFRAAQVSLGLLGIITEVTFQCEPSFLLEETMKKHTFSDCLSNLKEIAHSAEHVKLWVELYSGSCDVYSFRRTEKPAKMNTLLWRNIKMHLWEPCLLLSSWLPSLAPTIVATSVLQGGVFYPEYTQVGKSFEILTYSLYVPRNVQTEISVDIEHCVPALQALHRETLAWRPAGIFVEVRFVRSDDIWLSMNYHRHSCHITVIIYNPSTATKTGYFSSLYQVLRAMDAKPRPHFGKYFNVSDTEIQGAYPKYSDFIRVRKEMDPKSVFLNDMLATIFSPQ